MVPAPNQKGDPMTEKRRVKVGDAKMHLLALLAEVEAGKDLVICRGSKPVAHVTPINIAEDYAKTRATLRRERAKQSYVTSSELLSWRHERHSRQWCSLSIPRLRPLGCCLTKRRYRPTLHWTGLAKRQPRFR